MPGSMCLAEVLLLGVMYVTAQSYACLVKNPAVFNGSHSQQSVHRVAAQVSLLVAMQVARTFGRTGVCQEKDRRAQTGSGAKVHSEATQLGCSKAQEIRFQERREAGPAGGQEVGSAGLFAFPWQAAGLKDILPFRSLFIVLN